MRQTDAQGESCTAGAQLEPVSKPSCHRRSCEGDPQSLSPAAGLWCCLHGPSGLLCTEYTLVWQAGWIMSRTAV